MRIYMSYSIGFNDWNFDELHKGTDVRLGCPTMRFREDKDGIKMLDWDYREWKKRPAKVEERHLDIVKNHDLEVVMSMDAWPDNVERCIEYTRELLEHVDRVLIPFHVLDPRLLEFDLAYPNANWFSSNVFPTKEFRKKVTHVLGGSPSSQVSLCTTDQRDLHGDAVRFPNIDSVDGNQIFNAAFITGKYWSEKRPHWRKPKGAQLTVQQIYKVSIDNITQTWNAADERMRSMKVDG